MLRPGNKRRYVSHFSCGAASAVATKILVEEKPNAEILILNAYIAREHPDNRRFYAECEKWVGRPFTTVQDTKYAADPYHVFKRHMFTKHGTGAKCSKLLKMDVLDPLSRPFDMHVLGYTTEEKDRLDRYMDANNGVRVWAPLIEKGLSKSDCLALIERAGIQLPAMYRMGYNNANCIGCVKGGMGYWNKIRVDFPDTFEEMARVEALIGPAGYLFYDKYLGTRYSLRQLDPNAGAHDEPEISCSAACELTDSLIQIKG